LSLPLLPELPEHAPEVEVSPCVQVDVVDLAASALVINIGASPTANTATAANIAIVVFVFIKTLQKRRYIKKYLDIILNNILKNVNLIIIFLLYVILTTSLLLIVKI
jgi:hypothetical protein